VKYFENFRFEIPNKHFGTKVRTMVRFFVPLWSQSSQRKAFPTENSLNDFCVSSRHCARLGSNLPAVWRIFFFTFSMFKYYFFIIWEYLLILSKNLEMPSTGTPKIPRFKIIVSMCECCCPFFYFLSLSRISEKSENSHHAKIVNYNAFSEFLQMVPKHNFIGPFKFFIFIG
jgi:hypothetical protein